MTKGGSWKLVRLPRNTVLTTGRPSMSWTGQGPILQLVGRWDTWTWPPDLATAWGRTSRT